MKAPAENASSRRASGASVDMINEGKQCDMILALLFTSAFISTVQLSHAYAPLAGVTARSVKTSEDVNLSEFLSAGEKKTMLVLGTYAADFNAIEYAQRLRYYTPDLQKRGITKIGLVLNCESESAKKLADLVDLPCDVSKGYGVELMVDPLGSAGKAFGVGKGWRPDDADLSPFVKLFGMLFGLGAWATLPAVIGGYIGNPFKPQPWIEDAMAVGQRKGRWPDTGLVLDEASGEYSIKYPETLNVPMATSVCGSRHWATHFLNLSLIEESLASFHSTLLTMGQDTGNKDAETLEELPVVGSWPRRPLELATLRLQNMLDISIKNWKDLAPDDASLGAGVLTQLGGCVVCNESGNAIFEWKDPGICAVCNFEDILEKIPIE
ncbi:hypothetical protein ACHAW5_004204 [Stephanodiscus triporus]|uniref:Uncharacterized protein n=1 Tax=Stephanodiscus triporus TaxID=2934178 RepID=A0ABD3PRZ5_9STRA